MKSKWILGLTLLSASFFFCGVLSSGGKVAKTGAPGEGTCVQCHAGTALNGGGGYVFVESSNMIFGQHALGETYDMTVTVGQTGNSLFGFSVVALDSNGNSVGTFTAGTDNYTENFTVQGSSRQYVTHNTNGGSSQDEHTFNFTWTAPSEDFGTITFYATGLAANGNGQNTGDKVYSATMESSVIPSTGINNKQNEVSINWDPIQQAIVVSNHNKPYTLEVFDVQGKIVLNKGQRSESIVPMGQLSTGYYVVRVTCEGKRIDRKIFI